MYSNPPVTPAHRKWNSIIRRVAGFVLVTIIPPLILLGIVEGIFRLVGLGRASIGTLSLAEEQAGLLRFSRVLFWSLCPGFEGIYNGGYVHVNRLGLRGPEITEKRTNEFRILSLGESSTFGIGVSDEETYSACLEDLLNGKTDSTRFTVINAGVSAYSSFQSLRYLGHRGLKLKPDLILFYHELNDYLPSSLRDSSQNEIGVTLTDKQLYESRVQRGRLFLTEHSALFRFLAFREANRRIRQFNTNEVRNPLSSIGLSGGLRPRILPGTNDHPRAALNENALGRRVSDEERRENLQQLTSLCRRLGIGLIIMHPSYRESVRHECLLAEFCRKQNVLMFDAYASLHPEKANGRSLFVDSWHPSTEGHRILAENLAAFVTEHLFRRRGQGAQGDSAVKEK